MVDNTDDIFGGKETVTTISGGIGPGGVTRTETTTTKDELDFEEGQGLDLDLSTVGSAEELDKEVVEEGKVEKKEDEFPNLLPEVEVKGEKERPEFLLGDKYSEFKDIFASVSSEINKKTLKLLAIEHPDFFEVSDDGVVTNKSGEVVETKEDFIKATGFDTGDIIYDNASKQFENEDLNYTKKQIEIANDAWLYITSSLQYESGNSLMSLFGEGEEETLDFAQFTEQMKIEVLNQLTDDEFHQASQEGHIMRKGVTGFEPNEVDAALEKFGTAWTVGKWERIETWNRYFKKRASTAISLEDKNIIITEAKSVVLGNQMKIQNAAAKKIVELRDNYENKLADLNINFNTYRDLIDRTEKDIEELNKKHGTYGYDKQGNIRFISYGRSWSKEDIAKQNQINVNLKQIGSDKVDLALERSEVLSLKETYESSREDFNTTQEQLFKMFLYDHANNVFRPAFKQLTMNKLFDEMIVMRNGPYMGPVLDVMMTAADGIGKYVAANSAFKAVAGVPALVVTGGVMAADYAGILQKGLSVDRQKGTGYSRGKGVSMPFTKDMFNTLLNIAGDRVLPVSQAQKSLIKVEGFKSEKDNWLGRQYDYMLGDGSNWNVYSGTKSVAELLGYVVALRHGVGNLSAKHAARMSKLKMAQVYSYKSSAMRKFGSALAYSLSKGFTGSKAFTGRLEMVKVTQRMLTLDNIADGKARGLNDFQALAYGNFLSFATGVSQAIMPDYLWFSSPSGKVIRDALLRKLSNKTIDKIATKKAVNMATKQFGINFFKEQLEEQADLALSDVVKGMYIAGHSPDILKAEVQAEVLRGTTLLTGALGSIQSRRTYKTVRSMTNRIMYRHGYQILEQGGRQLKILEEELAKVKNKTTVKDKEYRKLLEQDIFDLKQNMKDGNDRLRAIKAAPDQVTDEQIDLLIQKNRLIDERSKLNKKDKALVASELEVINEEIAKLDIKIKEMTPIKYSESVYKAMYKNVNKLVKDLGLPEIQHFKLPEGDYDKALELRIKQITDENKKIDDQIDQIDGSTPEGKKKITKLEGEKLHVPTFDQPGFIFYDDVNGKHQIFINEKLAKDSHNEAVMVHELFHAVLRETVVNSPRKIKGLSWRMRQELLKNPEKYANVLGKFEQYSYTEGVNSMSFDELFTIFSESLIEGDIKVDSTLTSKVFDFIRRSLMEIGINFSVSGPDGMIRFIRDYNNEVKRGRFSYGMRRVMKEGLKLNISKEAIAEAEAAEDIYMLASRNKKFAKEVGLMREDGSTPNITMRFEDDPLQQRTDQVDRKRKKEKQTTTYTTKDDNGEAVTITVKTLADGSREVSYFLGEAKFENRYKTENFKKDNTLTDEEIIKNVVAGEGETINKKPKTQLGSRSIKTKATTTSVYDQKKLVSDLKLKESTAKIVEENAKIRELILEEGIKGKGGKIVASEDLQNRLVENNLALAVSLGTFAAQNPNIMGLEAGKRINADQFISGYYTELSKLAGTYDASVNEFGQYLNTILPLRYGDILAAEKAGEVEGSINLDAAKEISIDEDLTPDEVIVGPEVDTAERFGIKEETKPFVDSVLKKVKKLNKLKAQKPSEKTTEQIKKLESEEFMDLDIDAITVKQAPNLLYKFTSKLFGIDQDKLNPKSTKWLANLRKNDKRGTNEVRAAQRAVVQNAQLILSTIFNEGHTKAFKSSGMPRSLLAFGYNKGSKRIKNNFPQYKKPNLSEKDLLEFVGVYRVKGKYEFRVDRNTGTKLLAIASITDRNMSLQAINENLKETGDITAQVRVALEDGMSKSSKSIFYIKKIKYQSLIQEKLPSIALKIDVADISKGKLSMDAINKIIADEFIDTEMGRKNGMIFAKQLTGKAGIIAKFAEAVQRSGPIKKDFDVFLSEQLEQTLYNTSITKALGITVEKNADVYTVDNMKDSRSRVGQFVTDVLLDEYNNSKKNKAAKKRLYEQIFMLMQQHVTAAKAGDGSIWFVDGTNDIEDAYYPEGKVYTKGENKGKKHPLAGKKIEKGGTLRYQLFGSKQGSSVDFAKFINTFLEGTGIKIGLTPAENKNIKNEYGIKALAPQKSSSVINDLVKNVQWLETTDS